MEAAGRYLKEISNMKGVNRALGQFVLTPDLELIDVPSGIVPYE
jgi:hypothetical protein